MEYWMREGPEETLRLHLLFSSLRFQRSPRFNISGSAARIKPVREREERSSIELREEGSQILVLGQLLY